MKSLGVGSFVASFFALGLMSSPALADLHYANLTGHYICMKNCQGMPGHSAYVTQNGWDLNLLTETNQPVRASTDGSPPNASGCGRGMAVPCTPGRPGHSVRQRHDLAQVPLLPPSLPLRLLNIV